MQGEARIRRLHWICRRGMKELDVLLEAFLANNREPLIQGAWPEFESFLEQEDDRLWDQLQTPQRDGTCQFSPLIEAIRRGN